MEEIDEKILMSIFERYKGQPGFVIVTQEEFLGLTRKAYQVLIKVAKENRLITYGEVARKIDLSVLSPYFQLKIGFIVGACSDYENIEGRPLISAIVINETTNYPGKGFWGLPRIPQNIRLNIQYSDVESGYKMTDEMLAFWSSEVQSVFGWWKIHDC